jgi:YidC/Oxa1 family membrane protein insertase
MEERRLLLAVALSLAVLTAYSLLFPSTPPPVPPPAVPASPGASPSAGAVPPPGSAPVEAPAPPASPARVGDDRERRVEVIAPDYMVAFTNRGARLVSWTLTRHVDRRGRPEEMVPARSAAVRPLDIETGEPEVDARLREALFQPTTDTLRLAAGAGPQALSFTWADGEVEAEKTLAFQARGLVAVTASVKRHGRPLPSRLVWGPGIGNATAEERDVQGYQVPQAVALRGGAVERIPAAKVPASGQPLDRVSWVGVEGHYFAALLVGPGGGAPATVRSFSLPAEGPDAAPEATVVVAIDASAAEPVLLYVGAKDYQAMARLGHQLERTVPVGDWIGPIVVPLMGILRWVHGHVANWGWAIVVLTILINLAMAPFRHYSIVNGMRMAKIAPEMKAIQERYRKVPLMDPKRQQMQEEIGALYARHGMSMSSQMTVGCLPLLLTMPFLFAFYRVLTVSVDLRGADFLWIPDLAAKDPLFITPILMGVSMFVMQKMTPTAMDPAQQRIMMMMPIILTAMFLAAPAGLNLYWLTSNVWAIAQQWVSMKMLKPAVAGTPRERKSK